MVLSAARGSEVWGVKNFTFPSSSIYLLIYSLSQLGFKGLWHSHQRKQKQDYDFLSCATWKQEQAISCA